MRKFTYLMAVAALASACSNGNGGYTITGCLLYTSDAADD